LYFIAHGHIGLQVQCCKLAPLQFLSHGQWPNGGANLPATSVSRLVTAPPFGAPAAPRSVCLAVRLFVPESDHVEQRASIPARGL
jgi:hypothetical protein